MKPLSNLTERTIFRHMVPQWEQKMAVSFAIIIFMSKIETDGHLESEHNEKIPRRHIFFLGK